MKGNFRVGCWLVQPSLNTISQNGTSTRLEPKVMEVLVCLAEHTGEVVAKEELLQTIWPDTFVSDDVLKRSVSELRRAFEDDARESKIIETIPKRGYRLVAAVQPASVHVLATSASPAISSELPQPGRTTRNWKIALLILVGTIGVGGLLLGSNVAGSRDWLFGKGAMPLIRSIAVLPLQNLSGDPAQEYFADGMTEELITELSRLSSLRVISRTSVMLYRKSTKPLPQIARELGVDGIVEGSVLRSSDRVRITAQLIYAPEDKNVWAQSYEDQVQDVLTLQGKVASEIAQEVQAHVFPTEQVILRARHEVSPEALEAYFRGNYYLHRYGRGFGPEEAEKAITYYRQAVALDPNFARAYTKMAEAYDFEASTLLSAEGIAHQKEAAERAIALDPTLSEGHVALAEVKLTYEGDWSGTEWELNRALELNPNSADAHALMATYLEMMGRPQASLREAQRAQELDPGSDHLSGAYCGTNQYEKGIALLKRQIDLDPNDGWQRFFLAECYAQSGLQKDAVEEYERMVGLFEHRELAEPMRKAYERTGYKGAIRALAKGMERLHASKEIIKPAWVAVLYARIGDKDEALRWLNIAYEYHDVAGSLNDPAFTFLHSDPRFAQLLKQTRLPQ